jgi:hypothetical protein
MKRVKRNQEELAKTSSIPQTKSDTRQVLELLAALAVGITLLVVSLKVTASYIYEDNQNLFDLTNQTGTTNLNSGDDQLSAAFNLDNSFTFYGTSYDSARMATNGCLHFGLGTGNINYNNYCGDYTPDPLPQYTNTLFPFWTDLIRDNNSKMLAKNFNDKAIFGWYNMREYNRSGSDNSFEVVLWNNNTFEFRYGELDIIRHDVLIGEQGSTSQYYQYLFYDECNTGTTNVSGTCVNVDWNNSSSNTLLENGGSLYGVGSGNAIDCSDPLNDSSCSGYAAAYLNQQCDLDALYDMACPLYWEAYDDQQCREDPQYAPFCAGYRQRDSVAFFDDSNVDYGYEEEPHHTGGEHYEEDLFIGIELTDEEWYAIDVEEFGQERVDEWFGDDVQFNEDGMIEWEPLHHDEYVDIDPIIEIHEEVYVEPLSFEPRHEFVEIFDVEELIDLYEFETIIREEIRIHEERHAEHEEEPFESLEELEEWFEEEMEQLAEADEIIEITESREELLAETEESREEEIHEEREIVAEELFAEEDESKPADERRSSVRVSALSVVAGTLRAASNSLNTYSTSNSVSGSSYAGSGSSSSSGSTGSYGASGGGSGGGMSTSNSPSVSEQFNSATTQTNQVLSMSGGESGSSTTFSITPMPTVDDSPQVMMTDVQVQDMQGEIDTAISGVMTASEADQIAEQIVAQNIQEQQEQAEVEQSESGQYGDESTLVAYLGYVVGFDAYRQVQIPQQETWYESRVIYASASIDDNTQAFYGLANSSLNKLGDMINMQPPL